MIERQLSIAACAIAVLTALIGATVTVESRYAKAEQVQRQMDDLWARQLKLRILELQLKPPPLSTADKALLQHLQQELREVTP